MIEELDKLILQLIKKTGEMAGKEILKLDDIKSISQMSNIIMRLMCLSSGLEHMENNTDDELPDLKEICEKYNKRFL